MMPATRSSSSKNGVSKSENSNLSSQKTSKKATKKPSPTPKSLPNPKPLEDPTSPIFFWKLNEVPYGPFCQWYPSPLTTPLLTFTIHTHPDTRPYLTGPTGNLSPQPAGAPITFTSCEQFMMAHKSHLFSPTDLTIFTQILSSTSPGEQKSLGQRVPNFTEEIWSAHRFEIVKWGNYFKFTQNEDLKQLLLSTGKRELVEASPRDRIWGVGFGAKNAPKNRERWGLNLLGKALMEVRDKIRREEEEKKEKAKKESEEKECGCEEE